MRKKIAVISLLLLPFAASAQVTFRGITSLVMPDTPYELAKGDFNNDGRQDLVSANFNGLDNKQVTVLLNTGTGTFGGANLKSFSASSNVLDVAVGDFNEDGNLDAVACSQPNANFSLLLGDGAGNFAAPVNFAAGDTPQGIAVGDMNKDNNLDVLVTSRGTPTDLRIYLGNGAGNFSAPTVMAIANVWDVAVADFNGDTNPDFAAYVNSTSTVQLWFGNGSGTSFTLNQTTTSVSSSDDVDVADLNNDGAMDLVTNRAYVMNNGTGTFGTAVLFDLPGEELAVGDVNNDGNPDIAMTDYNVNYPNIRIYLGNGAGSFTLLAKFETYVYPMGLQIVDVNDDSIMDIVGVGSDGSLKRVDILIGEGNGYFNSVIKYPTTTDPRGMVKGDFNEDGNIDIALCHSIATNNVSIYLGQGQGKFAKPGANYTAGASPYQVIALDYNKDSHLDLVTFNYSTASSVTIFTGDGNGAFTALPSIPVATGQGRITAADFNKDTNTDLVVSCNTGKGIYFLSGTGTGFNAPVSIPVTEDIYEITAGDFDGNGNPDLAALFFNTNKFLVLAGNGAGGFTEGTQYTAIRDLLEVYDFNNDAKPDVIAHSGSTTGNDIFINDGSGNFTVSVFAPPLSRSGLAYADMDGDGIKDLVVGSQNSISSEPGLHRIYKGSASGTFGTLLIAKNYSGGNQLVTHDVNGDGKEDIITTSFNIYEDYLAVMINTTGAPTCTPPSISSSTPSSAVCTGQDVTLSVTASGTSPFTYQWKKGASDIAGATASSLALNDVTAADAASYSCVITNSCGNITSSSIVVTVNTVCANQPPVMNTASVSVLVEGVAAIDLMTLISDADNNLDAGSLKITEPPLSGAPASISDGVLTIDYAGTSFSGADNLTVEVCDLLGSCARQQLTIEVTGDIVVYNAISPNGDLLNASWLIKNIELLPGTRDNKVTLYNRWGDEVFSVVNYNNQDKAFKGIGNGGNELPTGTYFYRIEFTGGRQPKTGYLVLRR
jgi:gliding motility-associated-like protein